MSYNTQGEQAKYYLIILHNMKEQTLFRQQEPTQFCPEQKPSNVTRIIDKKHW